MRPRRFAFPTIALAVLWSAGWIWVGLEVAAEVRGLRQLSETVVSVGRAAEEAGSTLADLDDVPLVGGRLEQPAQRVIEAGESAVESGRISRESTSNLSTLLGISIALIPSTPLLLLVALVLRDRRARGAGDGVGRMTGPRDPSG